MADNADALARCRVDGSRAAPLDLGDHDPREDFGWDKADSKAALADEQAVLAGLQARLHAEGRHAVLLVLQGIDASGKGGTIRTVLTGLNPAGLQVRSFGVPSEEERAHDYLWRIHDHVPPAGVIGVFDRSHYEDVIVVRVKGLVPEERWRRRYDHIRHFEQLLVDEGTTIVKVFLHLSNEEQRARLQDRVDDPDERWKFRAGDLDDRALWDDYMAAYTEALERTSTDAAPWYVVPADRKWVRDLVVARLLRDALERIDPQYPHAVEGIEGVTVV